jgi:hypothetical protein
MAQTACARTGFAVALNALVGGENYLDRSVEEYLGNCFKLSFKVVTLLVLILASTLAGQPLLGASGRLWTQARVLANG